MKRNRGTIPRSAGPTYRTPIAASLLTFLTVGCSADSSSNGGWTVRSDTLPNGVVRVSNSPPVGGIETRWTLRPEFLIGSMEGSGPEVFGQIKGIAALPDGGVAVLDAQAQEIRVFGADGHYVRSMGRRGEGPGELNDANGMVSGPDGLLRVNDPRNARLSFFDPGTGFVRSQQIEVSSYGWVWNAAVDSVGRTFEPTLALLPDGRWDVIRVFDEFGTWADTVRLELRQASSPADEVPGTYVIQMENGWRYMTVPFWPRGAMALDPRGYFWVKMPHENDYRIAQVSFARDTILEFQSQRPALPVSPIERDSAIGTIREGAGGKELDWSQVPAEKPIVEALILDDAGRVWVQVRAAETGTSYDVFSREGRYEGTVTTDLRVLSVPAPIVVGDIFYGVVADELDIQHVVRARIE